MKISQCASKPFLIIILLIVIQLRGITQFEIIVQQDAQEKTSFGYAIDANEDYLVIGNPTFNSSVDSLNKGSVDIYHYNGNGWVRQGLLLPDSTNPTDIESGFGYRVNITDRYLALGDLNKGLISLYLQEENDWTKIKDIEIPFNELTNNDFSLELINDLLIIGIPTYSNTSENTGAVFIFEDNEGDWNQIEKILPPEGILVTSFGHKISCNEDFEILVGSKKNNETDGGAFLYNRINETWTLKSTFKDNSEYEQGIVVDISNDKFVINGNDGTDNYLEIFTKSDEDWVFHEKVAEGISNIFSFPNLSIGDVVHINGNKLFVVNGLGGFVDLYEEIDGVHMYKRSFPQNITEEFIYEAYLHGFSLTSTDDFLFCGAFGYSENIEDDGMGAVFVYPVSLINNTEEKLNQEQYVIFPNPCQNKLNVSSMSNKTYLIESILDMKGTEIIEHINDESIDVSHLKPGLYYLKIIDENKTNYSKFVKI